MKGNRKKETDPFYSTGAWRAARQLALDRDSGECQLCLREGRWELDSAGRLHPVRATMVHHKRPIKEAPELALDLDNLVSLCDACHERMHPERHGGARGEEAPPLAVRAGVRVLDVSDMMKGDEDDAGQAGTQEPQR